MAAARLQRLHPRPPGLRQRWGSEITALPLPSPLQARRSLHLDTMDEKLSCEVGAYIWTRENCPEVRILHLYGFGVSDG